MKQTKLFIIFGIWVLICPAWAAQNQLKFDRYHTPQEIDAALASYASQHPDSMVLHKLTVTPGKRSVAMIEIGPEVKNKKKSLPAVLVAANLEGTIPISSEAALYLIQSLLEKPDAYKDKTWYILPLGNPDAAAKYFAKPLIMDARNARPHNDDKDDQTDEDGVEDLNGDGLITSMRKKDPQGQWLPIPGEPRLMKRADWAKGEKGIYKLYSEGKDNDGDGEYNEDGPGGVNIGVNFPHLFKFFTKDGGPWATSEAESLNLVKFIVRHREIGMTFVLGATNFCLVPPKGGRKGEADLSNIKVPKEIAEFMNIDPEKTYSLKEIMEMVQPLLPPGMEVTEAMLASFLGLGAVVNPLPDDLKFYQELSDKYKEYLKTVKLDGKRQDPEAAKDGSFELWAYYHLGVPSFSMDFWTLPEVKEEKKEGEEITPEKLEKMTNEEFIALGEEKINAFLKSSGAPDNFKAEMVINALKNGMMDTKKMAAMMRQMPMPKGKEGADPKEKALLAFSDTELEGKSFVEWEKFKHPTLGDVEIGGAVPYAYNTPPASMMENLLKGQTPWIMEIAGKMARIGIKETKVEALGGGLYRLSVWVENSGYLPYPTAMGKRNNRILPAIITLEGEGFQIIEGKKRTLIGTIGGHNSELATWIIQANKKGVTLKTSVKTSIAWSDSRQVKLGGAK